MSTMDANVKHVVGITAGGIVGGLVLAPLALAVAPLVGLGALAALPVAGVLALGGMWAGHKATAPST